MTSNNGLKVCTFNAKCDDFDYKCCIKETCLTGCGKKGKCSKTKSCLKNDTTVMPDSLVGAMIALTLIPSNADIYNIQNVKNKCVVEHLLKELARVHDVLSGFDPCNTTIDHASLMNLICKLNDMSGLCDDAVTVKDALIDCDICNLDYVDPKLLVPGSNTTDSELIQIIAKFKNVSKYDAYYSGTCLTLVRRSLGLCPVTKEIPCVDSLVLFFKFNEKSFVNVNINMGDLADSLEELSCKRSKVGNVVSFLKEHKDCGSILLAGPLGDVDYDVRQLLYAGDGAIPDLAQKFVASGSKASPVPSDFPCELDTPLYECLEFLLKSCRGEIVPYTWLLQYIRLKSCKQSCRKSCSKKSTESKVCSSAPKTNKCAKHSVEDCRNCNPVVHFDDCNKCPNVPVTNVALVKNRSQLRSLKNKADKTHSSPKHESKHESKSCCGSCAKGGKCEGDNKSCDQPACVSSNKCCESKCVKVVNTCNNCPVKPNQCRNTDAQCEIKCVRKCEYNCCDTKHSVRVNTCKDLCKDEKCGLNLCEKEHCHDDNCNYCDVVTVLKNSLSLTNAIEKVCDVNNRYTGFHNHFNKCLDCKYPRGIFQAWAMCDDYSKPCKATRTIDNNSELLAMDHFLLSSCLKNNVVCASLSDLCIEKCGQSVKDLIAQGKFNGAVKMPFADATLGSPDKSSPYVFDYEGAVIKSFFTHRVYCVCLDFPYKKKGCEVECDESLHGLGLTTFWSAISKYDSESVGIEVFQRYGLDKHEYFRSFFWNTCMRKSLTVKPVTESYSAGAQYVDKVYGKDCSSDVLVSFRKRSSITESEFYKHLLCVLSNSDSRDRFIITIAFMESLYKVEKMKCHLSNNVCDLVTVLDDAQTVKNLFTFLSYCFSEKRVHGGVSSTVDSLLALVFTGLNGLNSLPPATTIACDGSSNDIGLTNEQIDQLGSLITVLSIALQDNNVLVEVLARYASRSLSVDGSCCGCTVNASDVDSVIRDMISKYDLVPACDKTTDDIIAVLRTLFCGTPSSVVLSNLLEVIKCDTSIRVLLAIINTPVCKIAESNVT